MVVLVLEHVLGWAARFFVAGAGGRASTMRFCLGAGRGLPLAGSGMAAFGRHGRIADICVQAAEGGVAARFVQNCTLAACSKFCRLSDAF